MVAHPLSTCYRWLHVEIQEHAMTSENAHHASDAGGLSTTMAGFQIEREIVIEAPVDVV